MFVPMMNYWRKSLCFVAFGLASALNVKQQPTGFTTINENRHAMDCFIVSKLMKTYLLFLAQSLFPVWRLSDSDMYDRKHVILTNFTTTLQTIAKLDTFIYLLGKSMFLLVCWLLLYIMLDLLGISSQLSDETSWEWWANCQFLGLWLVSFPSIYALSGWCILLNHS